jgi:BioD-like phosphotransacetylase family protein
LVTTLALTSVEIAAGKTALCAGLGTKLRAQGRKVGFLKPLRIVAEKGSADVVDRDAEFMKKVLDLEESAESLCPVTLTRGELDAALTGKHFLGSIQDAYSKVAQGKDVVLVEGLSGLGRDDKLTQTCHEIVEGLAAKAIVVVRYSPASPWARVSAIEQRFGPRLLGLVVNGVPEQGMSWLPEEGVKVFGVLPQERLLLTVSVGELAEHLEGEILNSLERRDELVENVMVGAMCLDPATLYFNLKLNKAVIARGERADIQLAALETSTRCLILSGGAKPIATILFRAEEKGVPIIVTDRDTLSTVAAVEEVLTQARFHQEKKLKRLGKILDQHFDFEALYQMLD